MNQIKVLVYGAGAIGVYFGGKLSKAGHQVTFVDKPERAETIQEHGLSLKLLDQDLEIAATAISDLDGLDSQDLVLIAVKAFHTYEIAMNLLPVLTPSTIICSLQNGLENEKILGDLLGENLVVGCVPTFSGNMTDDHTLVQNAPANLIYGEMDHQPSSRLSQVYSHAGIEHKISNNITLEIWRNFIWNNSYNLISALTRTDMTQISSCEALQSTLVQMMGEIRQVAQAEGVELPDDIMEDLKEQTSQLGQVKSNMLKDLEAGQMPELEPLSGTLLKKAEQHGISTPVNQTVFNLMQLTVLNYGLAGNQ